MHRTSMDIEALQREEHAQMERLLRRYEREQRPVDLQHIAQLVTKHAFAEEAVLFPAARYMFVEAKGLTRHIERKHQRLTELLAKLLRSAASDPNREQQVATLFALLRADAREEEDLLLTALREMSTVRERQIVGLLWVCARALAPHRPYPRVSRRPRLNLLAVVPLAMADRLRSFRFARGQPEHETS